MSVSPGLYRYFCIRSPCKVTVLDNYKAVNINVVNGHVCGSMLIHVFLHSNLHSNPLCVSLVEVMLGAISSEQPFEQHIC